MDTWSFWKRAVVLIAIYEISTAEGDVLELFQPKDDNPSQLNDFLTNVQHHKSDFSFVKKAAENYQKIKKSADYSGIDSGLNYVHKRDHKRHAHLQYPYKKYRSFINRRARHRFRRHLNHRSFDVVINPRSNNGEMRVPGQKFPMKYKKEMDPDGHHNRLSAPNSDDLKFRTQEVLIEEAPCQACQQRDREPYEPVDSYQITNNPNGNNLYSVDAGQIDRMEEFHSAQNGGNGIMQQIHPNEIVMGHSLEDHRATTYPSQAMVADDVGKGFIEISNVPNLNKPDTKREQIVHRYPLHSARMRKHNLNRNFHPDRFASRRLFFVDDKMLSFDSEDNDYDSWPRARRDFFDALGMKNEEDYSEDNPYQAAMTENNTSILNDTHIGHNAIADNAYNADNADNSTCSSGEKTTGTGSAANKTTASSTNSQQKNMATIQEILEESTPTSESATDNSTKAEKREKKAMLSEIEDFDDIVEPSLETRQVRDLSKQLGDRILLHKKRILGHHHNLKRRPRRYKEKKQWRKRVAPRVYYLNPQRHKINKKEDWEASSTSTEALPDGQTTQLANTNEHNRTYEIIAHQIDEENEKLAQVANGHIASNIVDTVFDRLKAKSSLKEKFYSGLSRKHLNYNTGAMEFDMFNSNDSETEATDARMLLSHITNVLNKLVESQVRRKLCQRLPDDLKQFLGIIVSTKGVRKAANFVPNTDQGNFLFQTFNEPESPPSVDVKQLQETLVTLENLLLNYHKMNNDCQSRAQPVKDYIEDHVDVLRKMISCPSRNCDRKRYVDFEETDRSQDKSKEDLVEKQLESLGLGNKHEFVPNFDLDKIIKNRMGEDPLIKFNSKREAKARESEKFRRLQRAVAVVKERRENDRKIGELFGESATKPNKFDVNFEKPLVYNVE